MATAFYLLYSLPKINKNFKKYTVLSTKLINFVFFAISIGNHLQILKTFVVLLCKEFIK